MSIHMSRTSAIVIELLSRVMLGTSGIMVLNCSEHVAARLWRRRRATWSWAGAGRTRQALYAAVIGNFRPTRLIYEMSW